MHMRKCFHGALPEWLTKCWKLPDTRGFCQGGALKVTKWGRWHIREGWSLSEMYQLCKDVVVFFSFQPFIYSSISVSHPLPLSVCLSSLNKQTRSSCQLCPTPILDWTNHNLPQWHLKYATFWPTVCRAVHNAQMRVGLAGHRNKHDWISLTPFDAFFKIIFQPLHHVTFCHHS